MVQAESARWAGVSGDMAWVPAQNGRGFFITKDNGQNWTNFDFGNMQDSTWFGIREIQFVNHQDGWLMTADGTTLRTVDGGKSWTRLN